MSSLVHIVGKATIQTSLMTAILKVVSIITIFFILNTYSVYEYGLFELAMSVISVLTIFSLSGLNSVVTADIGIEQGLQNTARAKEILINFFKFTALLGLVGFVASIIFAFTIGSHFRGHIESLLYILSFTFILSPFRTVIQIILNTQYRFASLAFYTLLEESCKLLLIGGLILLKMDIRAIAIAVVGSQLLAIVAFFPLSHSVFKKVFNMPRTISKPFWESLLAHGKWGILQSYVNNLGPSTRNFLIRLLIGTEAVGIFAVAIGLFNHTASLFSVGPIIGPILARHSFEKEKFIKIFHKAIKYQLIANVFLLFLGVVLFSQIIEFLFPSYKSSVPLYLGLLFALIPLSFGVIYTQAFSALRLQRSLFKSIIIKNILVLIFGVILGGLFGLWGFVIEFVLVVTLFVLERHRNLVKNFNVGDLSFLKVIRFDEVDREIIGVLYKFIKGKIINYF